MYIKKSMVEAHFRETEALIREIAKDKIANWLLSEGYFPEPNIVPPVFKVTNYQLKRKPYNTKIKNPARRILASISFPKSMLTDRIFSVQDPRNYHDIVLNLNEEWDSILEILFPAKTKIFSYSLPIPLDKSERGKLGDLRAGRMIYEWIRMAESDLVVDATSYKLLTKTDITNFYSSIYTHSVAWAIVGDRDKAFEDKTYKLVGNKIDRLIQYSNDARTNGIPIGSALSDLIAEILLSRIDKSVSDALEAIDFLAVRFKDDYRILCNSEEDSKTILSTLSRELNKINLCLNENKTNIFTLPDGLYRAHDREYFPHSLKEKDKITFKAFEHTLMIALDIHRKYSGTSILEKFLSELLKSTSETKIIFSKSDAKRKLELTKFISLLFLVKRESEKTLSHVLSLVEIVYLGNKSLRVDLKPFIRSIVEQELKSASNRDSAFEVVWYIFFSKYISLGITNFKSLVLSEKVLSSPFVSCLMVGQDNLFKDSGIVLFRKPADCKGKSLASYLDIFQRHEKI